MSTPTQKRGLPFRDSGDILTGGILLIASVVLLFCLIPNYIGEQPNQ